MSKRARHYPMTLSLVAGDDRFDVEFFDYRGGAIKDPQRESLRRSLDEMVAAINVNADRHNPTGAA